MIDNPADDIPQHERRQVLENDRKVREGSYHSVARAAANDLRGGRFGVGSSPSVIGSSPIAYPQMPEGNPWRDPLPGKEPFIDGTDIPIPVGEPHEIEASQHKQSEHASSPIGTGDDAEGTPTSRQSSGRATFLRRF